MIISWSINYDVYTHTQTLEYYSSIKKDEIMLTAATCLDLEILWSFLQPTKVW